MEHARHALQGTARRFSTCWTSDGAAVITRAGATLVQTVFCPRAVPEELAIAAVSSDMRGGEAYPAPLSNVADPCFSSLLQLSSILMRMEQPDLLERLRSWLLERIQAWMVEQSRSSPLQDPLLLAILTADLSRIVSIVQSMGRVRLAAVASALGGSGSDGEGVRALAKMQLEELKPAAGSVEGMVWSLLAGRVDFLLEYEGVGWEALLFARLCYTGDPLLLAVERVEAAVALSMQKDLAWALLRYHCALKKPFGSYPLIHDLRPDRLGSRHDWSRLWLLSRSVILEHADGALLGAHFAGQLLANGYWHLAAGLVALDLSQFVRTERELESVTLAQRSFYRKQVEFVGERFGRGAVAIAMARRHGYYGELSQQTDLLIKAGVYDEAQQVAHPLLIEAVITGDDELIEEYLERIPPDAHQDMAAILCEYLRIKGGKAVRDREALVRRVSELNAGNLREKVAFAELAARICQSCPSVKLFPLLPDDQRRALLHRLSD